MKITILLSVGPEAGAVSTAVGIARSARRKGHEVTMFVMASAVMNLASDNFTSLLEDGVAITVCEYNRAMYKAPGEIEGVKYGSQFDLAVYAQDCDRFISFT